MNDIRRNKDLIFGHFTVGKGSVCVAILRPPKGSSSGEYKAALSFGAPQDSSNRKVARNIAAGRLFSDRPGRNFSFVCKSNQFSDVFKKALEIATDKEFVVEKQTERGRSVQKLYSPVWLHQALETNPNSIQAV